MIRRSNLAFTSLLASLLYTCTHSDDLDAIQRTMIQGSAGQSSAGGRSNELSEHTDGGGEVQRVDDSTAVSGVAGAPEPFRMLGVPLVRGAPTLTAQLSDFTHYDEHDRTLTPALVGVDGQVFALAKRFPYGSGETSSGSAGFFGPTHDDIKTGDLLRAFFWARCVIPDPKYGDCRLALVFEEVLDPYVNGGLDMSFSVAPTWSVFSQVFASMKNYLAGDVQLTFHLGFPDQSIEIGAVGLENYGPTLTLTQLESLDTHPRTQVVVSSAFLNYGDADCVPQVGITYPFGRAIRCSTLGKQFKLPESSGYQGRNSSTVRERNVMLATFWARCAQSPTGDGNCTASVVFEATQAPYTNAGLASPTVVIGPEWQQYFFPFVPTKAFDIEQVKFGIRLGYAEQILEMGPVTVVQYGPELRLSNMPETYIEAVSTP